MIPGVILMLIGEYWPSTEGGTERQCRRLAAQLAAQGIRVRVLTRHLDLSARRSEVADGVEILRRGILSPWIRALQRHRRRRPSPAAAAPQVGPPGHETHPDPAARFHPAWLPLRLEKLAFLAGAWLHLAFHYREIALIHVHESHWIAGFGAWLANRFRLPILVKEASFPVFIPVGGDVPFRRHWDRWRRRAHYLAQTPAAATALQAEGVDRISIVPNSVRIPAEQGDPRHHGEVLYVGNLHQGSEWKAFDILFTAWVEVIRQEPNARLRVVGAGDPQPWRLVLETGNAASTVEFAGPVPDPTPYFRQAGLFVLPSRREGMSNALLEAQSWGLPAVVSGIPGNLAVVSPGVNGLVVPVNDAPALARAILGLLRDPEQRHQLGAAARRLAAERFNEAGIVRQLIRVYEGLRESTPSPARGPDTTAPTASR